MPDITIAAVRRFNRFYTRVIGVLDEGHLQSNFALAEVRILFEIAHRASPTATELKRDLGLDGGYLSRLLRGLARRRLVKGTRSKVDGRERHLALTETGRAAVGELEARADADIARLLGPLDASATSRVIGAMSDIHALLDRASSPLERPSYLLRQHRPGDMGWVVQSHGLLYAREYAWDERFEALVARVVADFIDGFDPERERCWIAERHGVNVGSAFLVRHPEREGVAKLRLLLVEPSARGLGIGHRLVNECTHFAREAGYHAITLWTQSNLLAARRIYAAAGYQLVRSEPHNSFGHELIAETWELAL